MWKQYNDKYQVSSEGEVLNIRSNKLLHIDMNSKGYYRVRLNGKRIFVHRLVAMIYIPNPTNLPQVNHKDCNKLNNFADNLEWCTNQFNNEHSYLHGRISGRTKLTVDAVKNILSGDLKPKEYALLYNVSVRAVYAVKRGLNIKRVGI